MCGAQSPLSQLAALAEPVGRGARFPWQLDLPGTYMPGWCNGSAGQVHLWTLAAENLGEPGYWELAEKTAWNCWEDPSRASNLCCGLAGRAYALLRWQRASGQGVWVERARSLGWMAARCIREAPPEDMPGFEHSLFKGELGVALLAAELETPDMARMPFFESEGF